MPTKIKIIFLSLALGSLGAACTPGNVGSLDDGGVWVSADLGESWEQRALVYADRTTRKTMADTNVKKIIFSPGDERRLLAATVKDGLWLSWNAGKNWDQILASPDVSDAIIREDNPKVIYATAGPNIVRSEDEGDTWKSIYSSDNTNEHITSLRLRPDRKDVIYAGTRLGRLLISEDNGQSWQEQANLNEAINKIDFSSASSTLIYAGVSNRGLGRSQDLGKNWNFFTNEFREFSGTSDWRDFVLTPTGVIFASRYGILRTLNQGQDWTALPLISDSRDSNIYSLAVAKDDPLEIFYGTKTTFYHSLDGGFNWIPRRLPTSRAATYIAIDPVNPDKIYLGVSRLSQ